MIRLVRADVRLLDAAIEGDDPLARALGHDVAGGWATFRQALAPLREVVAADSSRADWGTRFFVTQDAPELVGWGGFKGPPAGGVVELGYEIAESRRNGGLATAAVLAMLEEAFAGERADTAIAHTLPERNASNRVLEKAGFRFDGQAEEQGTAVWRHSYARGSRADLIRSGIAAFNRRDYDTALTAASDDVTWEPFLARTEVPLLRGKEEIRAAWESQVETLDLRIDPEEFVPAGDDGVAVPLRLVGHGRGSSMAVSESVTLVWTFDADGRMRRVESFDSLGDAVDAAAGG